MKKGAGKLTAGIVMLVIGLLLPLAVIVPLLLGQKDNVTFRAPGSADLTIEKAGRYCLWNKYSTLFEGQTYSFEQELPSGMSFAMVSKTSGEEIPLEVSTGMTVSSGNEKKASIGYFDVTQPGEYTITVTGDAETRILSVGTSPFDNAGIFVGAIMLGGCFSFVLVILGIVFVVIGIVLLVRGSRPSQG
jgi:hypothetical protein